MIIDVKATKATSEADPAERYALKSMEKKSNLPILLGGFAACIVVYVQSLFMEGGARPEQPPEPAKPPEDSGQDRPVKLQLVSNTDDLVGSSGSLSDALDGGNERSTFAIRPASGSLDLADETPFKFFHTNLRSNWDGFAVSPVVPTPGNDNHQGDGPAPVRNAPDGSPGGDSPTRSPPTRPDHDLPDDDLPDLPDDDDEPDTDVDDVDPNRAPRVTGPVYLRNVMGCGVLVIALGDLLKNAEDPDGDALSVSEIAVSSGALTSSGAEWIYSGGPIGPVTISYKVSDGHYAVQQTAHFSVLPQAPIYGDEANNILLGSMCDDEIAGRGGDDNIDARAGDDVIDGGEGDDHIVAGSGDDVIFGRAGNDIVFGGTGNDHISGGDGADQLFGEEGDDIIFGDDGHDILDGGDGHDLMDGGAGDDLLRGGAGNDIVAGGDGDDQLSGGTEDDRLLGNAGADLIDGGAGHDVLDGGVGEDLLRGAAGSDVIDGGDGNDQLSGGADDDRLAGNAGADLIDGGDGNDVLRDGAGSDVVHGDSGDDTVIAAADQASDTFNGDSGNDTLSYEEATEALTIDLTEGTAMGVEIGEDSISGFENVAGGQGDDVMIAGTESVRFTGNGGNNEFVFRDSVEPHPAIIFHEIVDFKPGDLIKMSKYDIFEEVMDQAEDALEQIYGEKIDEDGASIRYRRDHDNIDRTVIEADLNGDNEYEITIALHGNHALLLVENS